MVGERKHSSCEHYHSIVMLFLKMMMMMAIIKLIKPDFGVKTSHAHGQGRFLRANNVLLNDSPFRPRFIEEVYHRVDNDVKEEDSRRWVLSISLLCCSLWSTMETCSLQSGDQGFPIRTHYLEFYKWVLTDIYWNVHYLKVPNLRLIMTTRLWKILLAP